MLCKYNVLTALLSKYDKSTSYILVLTVWYVHPEGSMSHRIRKQNSIYLTTPVFKDWTSKLYHINM